MNIHDWYVPYHSEKKLLSKSLNYSCGKVLYLHSFVIFNAHLLVWFTLFDLSLLNTRGIILPVVLAFLTSIAPSLVFSADANEKLWDTCNSQIKVEIPILLKVHSSRLQAVAWIFLAIFSLIRFQADYLLVVGVCLSLSVANIVGFTKCRKGTCLMWLDLIIHCVV